MQLKSLLSILLFLFVFVEEVQATESSCISKDQVQSVSKPFQFSPADLVPQEDLCNSQADEYKLVSILLALKNLRLDEAPLNNRYDQKILGRDFWSYLTERVKVISKSSQEASSCRNGAMAYVEGEANNTLFLCPLYFTDTYYSLYGKASILLHEARHIEGFPHTMCLAGNKVGSTGGCDEAIEDRGSYAVSTEALAKILFQGKNISATEKAKLRIHLLDSLESFNEPVNGVGNTALYLKDIEGKNAYLFDGLKLYPAKQFEGARVVSRFVNLQIVPRNGMKAFSWEVLQSQSTFAPAAGACAKAYNETAPAQRSPLLEVIDDGIYFACVYENKLSARLGYEMTEDVIIDLPVKIKAVFTSDEVKDSERDSYYAISVDNEFYRIRFGNDGKVAVTKVADPTGGFKHLFFFNSDLTGLTNQGVLLKMDFETNQWIPFPSLQGRYFQSSTRPFLWSSDFTQ